ncbi:uncharacterized protein LOC135695433 [Rhopilema esculentum]|uniref:uncharacterized protein LOC135695433 n=1 Tax=Rhopilema esculentum TaxID=499914 RepID=UPI0031DF6D1C
MLVKCAKVIFWSIFIASLLFRPDGSAINRLEFDSGWRGLSRCMKRCWRLLLLVSSNQPGENSYLIKDCLDSCSRKSLRQDKEQNRKASKVYDDYIILGPQSPVPPGLRKYDAMPPIPKAFHDLVDPAILTEGNCDVIRVGKVDSRLKDVVFSRQISLACIGQKGGVLVKWKRPLELRECNGYQINYRFRSREGMEPGRCFEVEKNVTSFLIDKSKGFSGQDELFLAVIALPLPVKCNIDMKKYSLCSQGEGKSRKKRDTTDTPKEPLVLNYTFPTLFPPFTPPANIITVGPGDPDPTNLTMPSRAPIPPFGTDSNCLAPLMGSTPADYAGRAHVSKVTCLEAGKFNKKSFIIHWDPPEDYKNKRFTHFQVVYVIAPKNVITSPSKVKCHQVDKTVFSHQVNGVDETDTIHVRVVAYPTYHKLNETMQRFIPCSSDSVKDEGKSDPVKKGLIAALITIVVITVIILVVIFFLRRSKVVKNPPPPEKEKVYVSYFPDTENYLESVQNLVAKFRKDFSINLIMDLLHKTEISELGLARWCHKQLSESKKIILVISKEYLKICQVWQAGNTDAKCSNDVNRVCNDLQFVVDKMFERKKNSDLIIILADVKQKELPEFLRGKQIYSWPKSKDEFNAIGCCIFNKEAVAIV